MRERLLNFFKNWSVFEIVFIMCSVVIVTIGFVVGEDKNIYSFIVSIVGVLSVIFLAKGWIIAPIVGILYSVLYGILAITMRYYGEMIVYIGIMLPMNIMSIISWLKNRDKENESQVVVNKISTKEYVYLAVATLILAVGLYFVLKALHTSELVISTMSLVAGIIAAYMSYRRSPYYAIAFLFTDLVRIVLWGISLFGGTAMYLPTVLCFVMFVVSDVYGLIHWRMEEKRQSRNLESDANNEEKEANG